jgi:hypothetical protein
VANVWSGERVLPAGQLGHQLPCHRQLGSYLGYVATRRRLIVQSRHHPPTDDKDWRAMADGNAARSAADRGRSRPAS